MVFLRYCFSASNILEVKKMLQWIMNLIEPNKTAMPNLVLYGADNTLTMYIV